MHIFKLNVPAVPIIIILGKIVHKCTLSQLSPLNFKKDQQLSHTRPSIVLKLAQNQRKKPFYDHLGVSFKAQSAL
jgi:hypothetical protein